MAPATRSCRPRLKELEARGLIERHVDEGPPIKVTYELTACGRKFSDVAVAIEKWGPRPARRRTLTARRATCGVSSSQMLEIIFLVRFCKKLAEIARAKNRRSAWAAVGAIGWIGGEDRWRHLRCVAYPRSRGRVHVRDPRRGPRIDHRVRDREDTVGAAARSRLPDREGCRLM